MGIFNSLSDTINKAKTAIEDIDLNEMKEKLIEGAADCVTETQKKTKEAAMSISETLSSTSEVVKTKIEQMQIDQKVENVATKATETFAIVKDAVIEESEALAQGIQTMTSRVAESEAMAKALEGLRQLSSSTVVTTTCDTVSGMMRIVGDKVSEVVVDERTQEILSATAQAVQKTGEISAKGLRVISGVQAVQDRKKSISTKEEADRLIEEISIANEAVRDDLNEVLEEFGEYKVLALKRTVGVFLDYLDRMNQKAKIKEYEFLKSIEIKSEEVKKMQEVDMQASDAIKMLSVGGGFAAIGVLGTPAIVKGLVTKLCVASTGTAINSLSGAAATNAALAVLGGGAKVVGGGGVVAGKVVMGAITTTATVGLAVVAVGTLSSAFYSKKASDAAQYLADVQTWAAQVENSWVVINGIKERVLELERITAELEDRAIAQLTELEPIVSSFCPDNTEHVKCFQKTAILIKSMSELAQTPILDQDGNFNDEANIVITKTEKILNKEL